jgi:hypothetical protein
MAPNIFSIDFWTSITPFAPVMFSAHRSSHCAGHNNPKNLALPQLDTVGELLLSLKDKSSECERRALWHTAFYPTRLTPVQRSDLRQESDPGSGFDISQIAVCLNSTKIRHQ